MKVTVNRERVRLLVDALRSGDYIQGQSYLKSFKDHVSLSPLPHEVRHCCLGVACEVAKSNGADVVENRNEGELMSRFGEPGSFTYKYLTGTSVCYLPHVVRDWYGFVSDDPVVTHDHEDCSATYLNDGLRLSFDEIADAFERTYLGGDVAREG